MNRGRRKIRIVLIIIVSLAIFAGLFYYYGSTRKSDSFIDEGTLILIDGNHLY